jgi:hypothetical protein
MRGHFWGQAVSRSKRAARNVRRGHEGENYENEDIKIIDVFC